MTVDRLLTFLTSRLEARDITRGPGQLGGGDVVLLRRFYVWPTQRHTERHKARFRIFLHRLESPDLDRHLHDHPWTFVGVILHGRYLEEVVSSAGWPATRRIVRARWSARLVSAGEVHRIVAFPDGGPVWSLIIAGRRRRQWGYLTETGWVPWDLYHWGPRP